MKQEIHPSSTRGFTLVEVIVVLGIIIGLSTVVFGYVQSAQTSAEVSRLMRDADFVRSAVVSYGQQHGGDYKGLGADVSAGTTGGEAVGTMQLVSVGLLPSRFDFEHDGDVTYKSTSAENPFDAEWYISGTGSGYTIKVGASDKKATSSLANKWGYTTDTPAGACTESGASPLWSVSCDFDE